jgi:hypothetical protein
MRMNIPGLCLAILMGATLCAAQNPPATKPLEYSTVYCSGFVSEHKVPAETYIISGEQSGEKLTFAGGDYVYINRGLNQGVHVGDEYSVVRPVADPIGSMWFKGQYPLQRSMGTMYADEGRIKIIHAEVKTSVAQVVFSCDYMQRGDIVRPFEERPQPALRDPKQFDHFAAPSGKGAGTVAFMKDFQQFGGRLQTAYVNLGSAQGVKVGDYIRIFRYQGTTSANIPQYPDMQYTARVLGELYGRAPQPYAGKDLPREVLGEGIVLNVNTKSATVLITTATVPIMSGDWAEVEQ